MKSAPIPLNESSRQSALESLRVLDTAPERVFDQITELASKICEVNISLVSLIDNDRQWFKSRHGIDVSETPRDISFCGHAILQDDVFEIEDAQEVADFCDNPLVTGAPHVRFYAGAPLITSDGFRVGTLCVIDSKKKKLNTLQKEMLKALARQVITILELRKQRDQSLSVNNSLEQAQEVAQMGNWEFALKSSHVYWSRQMFKIFQIPENTPSEDLYSVYMSRVYLEDRKRLLESLNFAIQNKSKYFLEHRILLPDESLKYIRSVGEIVEVGDVFNQIVLRGVSIDITKSVLQIEENAKRERFLEAVLRNVPSMIFVKNYNNNLSFSLLNHAGENLLGVSAKDLLGKNDYDFFPKEQADFFVKKDKEVFENKKVNIIEKEPIQTLMGQRWLKTYKVPTFDNEGRPEFLIGISDDITEELASREAVEKEKVKSLQNAKLATLGEMSASIAHEINNPLAIISGGLSLLKKSMNDSSSELHRLQTMERAVGRISKIINGLRKFSRTSQSADKKKYKLEEIFNEVGILVEPNGKKHSVVVSFQMKTPVELFCNEIEIEQVLLNLINNGIDAVKNLEERWVKIESAQNTAGDLILRVMDSGTGVPWEIEKKLFEPFFTTKIVGEGTGLGLSIAKGILDEHKAEIHLSREYSNTCFEIRFPSELVTLLS